MRYCHQSQTAIATQSRCAGQTTTSITITITVTTAPFSHLCAHELVTMRYAMLWRWMCGMGATKGTSRYLTVLLQRLRYRIPAYQHLTNHNHNHGASFLSIPSPFHFHLHLHLRLFSHHITSHHHVPPSNPLTVQTQVRTLLPSTDPSRFLVSPFHEPRLSARPAPPAQPGERCFETCG